MKKQNRVVGLVLIMILVSVGIILESCSKNTKHSYLKKSKKDIAFLQDEHWNKGKGEYQRYNGNVKWYGSGRELLDSMTVLVKEPWKMGGNVKTTAKEMNAAVLKFSTFDQFRTGTYNYSFKSDIFFDIDNGNVLKYTMGSQDGCGNNFMIYERVRDKVGMFTWFSYWNNHGTIVLKKPTDEFDTFYDGLPVYVRFRLGESSYKINMVQTLLGNHPPGTSKLSQESISKDYPKVQEANVTNKTTAYKGKEAIEVSVEYGDKKNVYILDKSFPHTLLSQKEKFSKELKYTEFFPYWAPKNRGKEANYMFGN